MVVEKVAEAPATDFEAQVTVAAKNSRCLGKGLDERDNMSAPPVEDRSGYPWTRREKGFLHRECVQTPNEATSGCVIHHDPPTFGQTAKEQGEFSVRPV